MPQRRQTRLLRISLIAAVVDLELDVKIYLFMEITTKN